MSDFIVDARDVHKRFGRNEVLKGVSLQVKPQEVVCIIGASGSGKTTFLRTLNQLETIDSGEIVVNGHRIGYVPDKHGNWVKASDRAMAPIRSEIGFVFQRFNLWPHMTVLENIIEAPVRVRGMARDEAIAIAEELLRRVRLSDKRDAYPGRLSGGQQQMLAVGRALMANPTLILLDEPTEGLAPVIVDQLAVVFKQVADQGTALLLIEQNMSLVVRVAERYLAMAKGSVVAQGVVENSRAGLHDLESHVMV